MLDPYLDLDSGVLRNLLGIIDPDALRVAEADLVALRMVDLRTGGLPGRYDLDHLQDVHHELFQDVYDWAGEIRTVTIGKGALFCRPEHIEEVADDVFARLAGADHLRGLPRLPFLEHLTSLLADINRLHPFREGNGRTQRTFLAQLVEDAGHRIRWVDMDPAENIAASRTSMAGDDAGLATMLDKLLDHDDGTAPSSGI